MLFNLKADYVPTGDQPQAIEALVRSIQAGHRDQTLLGVTGSGKTFTMASVIARCERPTLVMSHNKTLAAQLYSEFKVFFPENAVEYFVSYYDYYQPEAYIPSSDTFIEKDSSINEEIERLRISATSSLVSRRDVIVVASVSCIYGLGSPEDFKTLRIELRRGEMFGRTKLLERLVDNQYERNDYELKRGRFRVRGDVIDIMPAYSENALRVELWGDTIESITESEPLTGAVLKPLEHFDLYPANQYVTTRGRLEPAITAIKQELDERVAFFEQNKQYLEAQRIRMRTNYDLEMLQEMGFCSGIENYSLHLTGRKTGERPNCLIDFFPKDFLLFIDESHASVPQIGGMFNGDYARKKCWPTSASACPRPSTTARRASRSFCRSPGRRSSSRPRPRSSSWSVPPWWPSSSSVRPACSIRKSPCARRKGRSRISSAKSNARPPPANACW